MPDASPPPLDGIPEETSAATPKRRRKKQDPALTYQVICISIYPEDLEAATKMVDDIKARGHAISLSRLVRIGLRSLDLDEICVKLASGSQLR